MVRKLHLPPGSYAWRLEAAVWTRSRALDEGIRCRPRLLAVTRHIAEEEDGHSYGVMGFIEYDLGGPTDGPPSWLVYHYPKDAQGLWEHQDETRHRFRHVLSEGEQRFPRPSAGAALAHLLHLLEQDIPRPEHAALQAVGGSLLPSLQALTDAYLRRSAGR